jgi:beta-lactam-binding protein with PASTA domain
LLLLPLVAAIVLRDRDTGGRPAGGTTPTPRAAASASPSPSAISSRSPATSSAPAAVAIPAGLVGMTYDKAAQAVSALGLKPVRRAVAAPEPAGTVVASEPAAGAQLTPGGTVTLVTSSGPAVVPASPSGKGEPKKKKKK